jgi:filamentous hemagglutinin family protein
MFGQVQDTDRSRRASGLAARTVRRAALLGSACALALAPSSVAAPDGGVVVGGNAVINGQGSQTTTIDQSSARAIINWNNFSVDADGLVAFHQPSAESITLNRVIGQDPSSILGQITANGRIVLVNPNGVLFGAGSRIDVAGLIATTHDISNARFMAGDLTFDQSSGSSGFVVNEGLITVAEAGLAAFVAPHVRNSGVISARLGTVALGGASRFTVDFYGDDLITFPIDAEILGAPTGPGGTAVSALVANDGSVIAEGGTILMTASAARGVVDDVILAGGELVATSFTAEGGRIVLHGGDAGDVRVAGALEAGGTVGGTITIDGERVLADGAISANGSVAGGAISLSGDWLSLGGSVAANGASGGRVNVTGGTLALAGDLSARGGSGAGGAVDIAISGKSYELSSASIDVSGAVGGSIRDIAGQQLTTSAFYNAGGSSGAGGRIDLSASSLKLLSASLDASGASGGLVRLGGEFQGGVNLSVDELPNAATLVATDGTRIDVSGSSPGGAGGEAIVWSETKTVFLGAVDARPGEGGAGGFIEVSSKGVLDFNGDLQTGGGHVLLDPKFLTIVPDDYDELALILGFNYTGGLDGSLAQDDLFGFALDLDANRLVVGAPGVDAPGKENAGAVFLFTFGGANYSSPSLTGVIGDGLIGPNARTLTLTEAAAFGDAVSLDGARLAVGAPGAGASGGGFPNAGAAYLFSFTDNAFTAGQLEAVIGVGYSEGKDLHVGLGEFKFFGAGLSLDGDRLAVGAPGFDGVGASANDSGAVFLFTFDEVDLFSDLGVAHVLGFPNVPNLANGDFFGRSVALDGDWLAVGAIGDGGADDAQGFRGAAYLFSFNSGDLTDPVLRSIIGDGFNTVAGSRHDIDVGALDNNDFFGAAIDLDLATGRLAIGAPLMDGAGGPGLGDSGAVYLIELDFTGGFSGGAVARIIGADYSSGQNLALGNIGSGDLFGEGVALDGNWLAVGAPGDDGFSGGLELGNSGAVYMLNLGLSPSVATLFGDAAGDTSFMKIGALLGLLNAGQTVTLQANSDITVTVDVIANNPGGNGGNLILEAGRSLIFAAEPGDDDGLVTINTDGGDLTLIANQTAAEGVVNAHRDPGAATIDLSSAVINLGAGVFSATIETGAGNTNTTTGTLTLGPVMAGRVLADHLGSGDLVLTGAIAASQAGDSILLNVTNGAFVNTVGAGALNPGAGRYVVFSDYPDPNTIGGLTANPWYNAPNGVLAGLPAGGNVLAYSVAPEIQVVAADRNRFYGDANPDWSSPTLGVDYLLDISGLLDGDGDGLPDVLANALSGTPTVSSLADATSGVSTYDITVGQDSLSSAYNYTITLVNGAPDGGVLTVDARPITVGATLGQGKVYGFGDPALTHAITSGNLVNGDTFSGSLGRIAGEDVANYAFTANDLALSSNYALTFDLAGETFAITPRALTIGAAPGQGKVYGFGDPALVHQITSGSLAFSDTFSGSLGRVAGEDVDDYAFTANDLALSPNYTLTFDFAGETFAITPRAITVGATPGQGKVYGFGDPALTHAITSGSLAFSDTFSGSLGRVAGEDVDDYAFTANDLALSPNYTLTFDFAGETFAITPRAITVGATPGQGKVYGFGDPALTHAITSGSLAFSDTFSGSLGRVAGEDVDDYAFTANDLALSPNYVLTIDLAGQSFAITPRPITVGAAPGQGKVYGSGDPALAHVITSGSLAFSDTFTGSLGRIGGENVANYAFTANDLALSPNYALTFDLAGQTFVITPRALTVEASDVLTKIYGDADPDLAGAYTITAGSLVGGDAITGAMTRVVNENVGAYAITQGSLTAGGNYTLTFVNGELTITKADLLIMANNATRGYGAVNPVFTASYDGFKFTDDENVLSGLLLSTVADPSSPIGTYDIVGSGAAAANYNVSYAPGTLTVTPATLFITAVNATRVYGDVNPVFSATITGLMVGDDESVVNGLLLGSAAGVGANVGAYDITASGATAANYAIQYTPGALTITPAALLIAVNNASRGYGDANPVFSATYTGFKAGDDAGDLTGLAFATPATQSSNVGTYDITASGAVSQNYIVSYANPGTLMINPALLTVVANDADKLHGDPNPAFSATVTGFKLGQNQSLLTGLTLATTALDGSAPGDYVISSSGGIASNYVIGQRINGVLTILGGPSLDNIVAQVENDGPVDGALGGDGGAEGADFVFANDVGSTGDDDQSSDDAVNLFCLLADDQECSTADGGAE